MNPGDRRRSAQGRVNLWASQAAKSAHGTTTPLALDLTLPQGVGNMQYLTFLTCFRLFEAPHRRQGLVCDDKTYSGSFSLKFVFVPCAPSPRPFLVRHSGGEAPADRGCTRSMSSWRAWCCGRTFVAAEKCLLIGSVNVTIHLLQAHGPWDAERHMESRHSIYWSVSSCLKKHSASIFIFYLGLFR
jgi:hypothetical protein